MGDDRKLCMCIFENVYVTRHNPSPPPRPITINGVVFDHWLNIESGRKMEWDGENWEETP